MLNHLPRIRENAMFTAATSECVDACSAARQSCEQCAMNSVITGETRDDAVLRCLDCVAVTTMTALVIARGSPLAVGAAALCAAACELCAETCEAIADRVWRNCGAACREAADRCRELAAMYERRAADNRVHH